MSLFKKSQKWFRPKETFLDLKKLFEGNLLSARANTGIWLFDRVSILHVFSREIYVEWSSNQYKNAFKGRKKLFEGNPLFARGRLESGYSPGRIYFMYFIQNYTTNEVQINIKTIFKAQCCFLRGICGTPCEHWNLIIRPGENTSCFFLRNIRPMKIKPR